MLTIALLAHAGSPLEPHDLWSAWNLDPPVLAVLTVAAWAYARGSRAGGRPTPSRRRRCFWAALAVVAVALVSPLEPLSGVLASAHMVQHVLLVLVAAPLFALSAPSSTLLRGSPVAVRRIRGTLRRRLRLPAATLRAPSHPAAVWLAHVGVLWWWHGGLAYDAAVRLEVVHIAEHALFLITGVWFWRAVVGARRPGRVPDGLGMLLVFGMAMQSVFLSVLLTFARTPWYEVYATTTRAWGLGPLQDQQLAGVLMWVPAGAIYLVAALALFARWMGTAGADDDPDGRRPDPLARPTTTVPPDRYGDGR